MTSLTLRCPAKINLTLDVTGRREDGYHTLASIFQSVDVYDTLTLTVTEGTGIALRCETPGVPCDETNLAWRAAKAFLDTTGLARHVDIVLEKGIPSGAGMGGGSADAAGVLWGLDRLLETHLSDEQLRAVGVTLGADVPFLMTGGTALAEGIGEILKPLRPLPTTLPLVIVKGEAGISTPAAYRAIDALTDPPHPDVAGNVWAVETRQTDLLIETCGNLFEDAVDCADVDRAKQRLLEVGAACAVMTGSGAAVFGIFPAGTDDAALESAAETLKKEFAFAQAAHPAPERFTVIREA